MYAAQAGNVEAVTFLIASGSNTEQQRRVRTATSHSSNLICSAIIHFFFISLNVFYITCICHVLQDGRTALQIAASSGRKSVVGYLLHIGALMSVDKVRVRVKRADEGWGEEESDG